MLFIAIGASIRTFLNYLRPVLMIDAAHLKGLYKGTNLVAVAMDGNNQIVPIAFGICKGETGPCWSWWMSVLKECIGDHPNLLFISDRHAAIALAVEKEFPLAFHAAYTREDYATNMNTLQIVQPDAHEKLCRAGPQRWSRAHCPLIGLKPKYQATYSDSIHFLGNMQQWEFPENIQKYSSSHGQPTTGSPKNYNRINLKEEEGQRNNTFCCGSSDFRFHPQIDLSHGVLSKRLVTLEESFAGIDLSTVLIPNDGSLEESFAGTNIHALYYKIPHNGFSVTVKLRNNYDMHVMFDICSAQHKLEIYIDHICVNFVIHKYIFPNASLAEMMNHVITDYSSENEGIIRQETQNDYTSDQMVEWAEQEHFEYKETKEESFGEAIDEKAILEEHILALMHRFVDRFMDRRVEINNLLVLHDHSLVDYGKYALGCMPGADMKKCVYLKSVRDELLKSMEEKR
ncbi:transposase, MuDR, MULE transposase domain protein [Tanacetum coccineum]